jgi:hypothetical protein
VEITVTAENETTTSSHTVIVEAPSGDTLTPFLIANNLTLFNNSDAILINRANANQKVAVCFTNNKVSLITDTTSTTTFSGNQIVLVVSVDNGTTWKKFYNVTSEKYISLFSLSILNNNITLNNTRTFLDATKNTASCSITMDYSDDSKFLVSLVIGGYNRSLLVDTTDITNNLFYRISKGTGSSASSFVNYSKDVSNYVIFDNFDYTKLLNIGIYSFNNKSYPIYAGYATKDSTVIPFIFIAGILSLDKAMLVSIFADNVSYVKSCTSFSLDVDNNGDPVLIFNFTQYINSSLKTYKSTSSITAIKSIFTNKINTTTYDLGFYPTVVEVK